MKNKMALWLRVGMLIAIFVGGCNGASSNQQLPALGISPEEINSQLHIVLPNGMNSFKIGDSVGIGVEVISENQVALHYDYGLKIFLLEEDEWIEVPNLTKYPEGYLVLSPAHGDPFKLGTTFLDPALPESDRPVTLRIVVIGNIFRDGQITDTETAAYIDIKLDP